MRDLGERYREILTHDSFFRQKARHSHGDDVKLNIFFGISLLYQREMNIRNSLDWIFFSVTIREYWLSSSLNSLVPERGHAFLL